MTIRIMSNWFSLPPEIHQHIVDLLYEDSCEWSRAAPTSRILSSDFITLSLVSYHWATMVRPKTFEWIVIGTKLHAERALEWVREEAGGKALLPRSELVQTVMMASHVCTNSPTMRPTDSLEGYIPAILSYFPTITRLQVDMRYPYFHHGVLETLVSARNLHHLEIRYEQSSHAYLNLNSLFQHLLPDSQLRGLTLSSGLFDGLSILSNHGAMHNVTTLHLIRIAFVDADRDFRVFMSLFPQVTDLHIELRWGPNIRTLLSEIASHSDTLTSLTLIPDDFNKRAESKLFEEFFTKHVFRKLNRLELRFPDRVVPRFSSECLPALRSLLFIARDRDSGAFFEVLGETCREVILGGQLRSIQVVGANLHPLIPQGQKTRELVGRCKENGVNLVYDIDEGSINGFGKASSRS
ncbi:hypothetical protein JAAARDRAFT_411252 [Jaapia argillacea MUCL 33604]|uniref:F-box domain-containing protein n=1 Tax=Jaapia argillacea MUCL 33604 TaxID=933084 RepID=A0A067PS11_9AGAM|nr:hypothetical protein JAAARDRAFT_411252 [Jaapia argillacea MUCL 33604]